MEMTPGVLVSAQQADLRTDPLPETQGQDTAPAAGENSATNPQPPSCPTAGWFWRRCWGCLLAAVVLLVLARRHAMGYGRGSCNARVLAVFGSIYRLWCAAACRRIHHPMRRSLPHFCKVVSPPLNPRMPKLCWHWPKPPNLAQVR